MLTTLLNNPIAVLFLGMSLSWIASTLGHYWHKVRKLELEVSLKLEMVQRGMSAEEICKVLESRPSSRTSRRESTSEQAVPVS
jgi:hypothetical protein